MPKRVLQGVVVSDKNDKTIIVKVERRLLHPVFKKTVRLSKKYIPFAIVQALYESILKILKDKDWLSIYRFEK